MSTYYINADSGDNGNTGGSGDPWLTLAYALSQMAEGDTVIVQDATATYSWIDTSFTFSCTVKGESTPPQAAFDAGGAEVYWLISGSNVTVIVQNLEFKNADMTRNLGYFIAGNSFGSTGTVFYIDNCLFHDLITIADNYGGGIFHIRNGTEHTFYVTNCLIYDYFQDPLSDSYAAITSIGAASSSYLYMTNCTVYVQATTPIDELFARIQQYNEFVVSNSIFYTETSIPATDATTIEPTLEYSCFYGFSDSTSGTGVITSDPLFVDKDARDFRLKATSPCIDAGILI